MSLLSICTQVANDLALAVPTAIVGNSDETATRLLAQAQAEGEALARKPENGWVCMILEHDFTTAATPSNISGSVTNVGGFAVVSGLTLNNKVQVQTWQGYGTGLQNNSVVTAVTNADPNSSVTLSLPPASTGVGTFTFGQSDYPLPTDYQRPIDNTMWDRSRFWSMRGPQSPQQWQLYKSSVIGRASIQRRFRFREIGGAPHFSVDPVPPTTARIWCLNMCRTPGANRPVARHKRCGKPIPMSAFSTNICSRSACVGACCAGSGFPTRKNWTNTNGRSARLWRRMAARRFWT